jgi:hypothetical protein
MQNIKIQSVLPNDKRHCDHTEESIVKKQRLSDGSSLSTKIEYTPCVDSAQFRNMVLVFNELKQYIRQKLVKVNEKLCTDLENEKSIRSTFEQENQKLKEALQIKENMHTNILLQMDAFITVNDGIKESQVLHSVSTLSEFFSLLLHELHVTFDTEDVIKKYTDYPVSKCPKLIRKGKKEKFDALSACAQPESSFKLCEVNNETELFGEGLRADACIIPIMHELKDIHVHNVPIIVIMENKKDIFFSVNTYIYVIFNIYIYIFFLCRILSNMSGWSQIHVRI